MVNYIYIVYTKGEEFCMKKWEEKYEKLKSGGYDARIEELRVLRKKMTDARAGGDYKNDLESVKKELNTLERR